MSDLRLQRRLAADVAGCGEHRIWFDPEKSSEIEGAISRDDVRTLLANGTIQILEKKGTSKGRSRIRKEKRAYGHCRGPGRRRGAKGARAPSKRQWIQRIRALRRSLREMREGETIDRSLYRYLYRKASGGEFRSVSHLKSQAEILSRREV
jgi:large subunit ribosomal protein L19e